MIKSVKFKHNILRILNISIPSGLNSLLDIINVAIGLFMISKLSDYHIVATGLGLNYFMLLYVVINIFFIGTNVQVSQLYGKRDLIGVNIVFSSMFWGALILSFPIYFIANFSFSYFFNWIINDEAPRILGGIFTSILILNIPALLTKTTIIGAFSAIGDTKTPFIIKGIVTIIDLILNYIFIFVIKLDIVGAALSSVIATHLELLTLLFLCSSNRIIRLKYILRIQIIKKGLLLGIPTGIERAFTFTSFILIAKFIALYSSSSLAGLQIGTRIEAFAFMPSFGFLISSMSLVGQYIGSNKIHKIKSIVNDSILIASFFMFIMGFLMIIFSKYLSSIFSNDPDVLYSSVAYLICVGISQVPLVIIFILDGAFRGAGATKLSLYINTISIWMFRILPMYLCVSFSMPMLSIYIIILVETFIRGAIFFYIFSKYFNKIFVLKT